MWTVLNDLDAVYQEHRRCGDLDSEIEGERVRRELPVGNVTVCVVEGGLVVPGAGTLIACAAVTVRVTGHEES